MKFRPAVQFRFRDEGQYLRAKAAAEDIGESLNELVAIAVDEKLDEVEGNGYGEGPKVSVRKIRGSGAASTRDDLTDERIERRDGVSARSIVAGSDGTASTQSGPQKDSPVLNQEPETGGGGRTGDTPAPKGAAAVLESLPAKVRQQVKVAHAPGCPCFICKPKKAKK